jgi:hypothetical protein
MFLHLGRTLSEAFKVFALGRKWLGAVKFLTFRDSAHHKLQILAKKELQHTNSLYYYLIIYLL